MQVSAIAEQYGLPKNVAAEIIGDELRNVLLRRWESWAWLLATLALAVGLIAVGVNHTVPLLMVSVSLTCWATWGRSMSAAAVHRAAAEKASRLGRSNA